MGRNYARRRLREYFRRNKDLFPPDHNTLIRLYRVPHDWDTFLGEIERLLAKARRKLSSKPAQRPAGTRHPES